MASKRAVAYIASDACTNSLMRLARLTRVPGMEPEDMVQAAKVELLASATRPVNEAWLYKRAKGVMLSVARREYRRAAREVPADSHEVSSIADDLDQSASRTARLRAACRFLLRSLPIEDRRIVREIVRGARYAVVAARFGISDSQVSRVYTRSLATMGAAARENGIEFACLFAEGDG
ncbi:MAG TPA: hypothetical protein VNH18_14815 [Bryobacteraceae bacterium]|nr:hypothetical protein [Bryobacteraceae bacterium]